jgi:hypothetical protein
MTGMTVSFYGLVGVTGTTGMTGMTVSFYGLVGVVGTTGGVIGTIGILVSFVDGVGTTGRVIGAIGIFVSFVGMAGMVETKFELAPKSNAGTFMTPNPSNIPIIAAISPIIPHNIQHIGTHTVFFITGSFSDPRFLYNYEELVNSFEY